MKTINFYEMSKENQDRIWLDLWPGIIPSDGEIFELFLYDNEEEFSKIDNGEMILLNVEPKYLGEEEFSKCAISWFNK